MWLLETKSNWYRVIAGHQTKVNTSMEKYTAKQYAEMAGGHTVSEEKKSLNLGFIGSELTESKILIKQPFFSLPKEESLTNRAIGWIFRRNLDYVSLNYNNGDWNRKFSWTCEITSLSQLQLRINEKLNKLIKVNHKSLY